MAVQEWIILLGDLLLIANNYENLPNVEAACDHLDCHQREVNPVTVLQNVVDGHEAVERVLKVLV